MLDHAIEARVSGTRPLSPSVLELTLEPRAPFRFVAGQYLRLFVPGSTTPPDAGWIPYSIGSAPDEEGLTLMIKLGAHRASDYVEGLAIGSTVRIDGPFGRFGWSARVVEQSILIGGGTGLAPLRSLIRSRRSESGNAPRRILVLGASVPDELLYYDELSAALGMDFWPVVIAPSPNFKGDVGLVTDVLARRGGEIAWERAHFYLCGPAAMLAALRPFLADRGVAAEAITDEH
ncbi:MAG: hypothetical protein KC609_10225 [Myxococcales bacterium]|nr:hypothetical protein [Myxococcales bacterium]